MRGDDTGVTSTPSCDGAPHVIGRHSVDQLGLVNCYVAALRHRSLQALVPLTYVDGHGSVLLSADDLRLSPAARTRLVSVEFLPDTLGVSPIGFVLHFGGKTEKMAMTLGNPASAHSWRLLIGTERGLDGGVGDFPTTGP